MDYEQKYNKLVNAIKVLQETNPSDEGIRNWVNDNVPELRESEDEKVRKFIIEQLFKIRDTIVYNSNLDRELANAIDWLEKLKVFTEHGDGLYHFGNSEFTYVGNPTWNEADDEEFEIAIDTLKGAGQYDSAAWLLTLKQRIEGSYEVH